MVTPAAVELGPDEPRQLHGTGIVAVEEDGVGLDRDVEAGNSFDQALADHADCPFHDHGRIVDDCAFPAPGHQGAVGFVSAVRDADDGYVEAAIGGGQGQFAVLGQDDEPGVSSQRGVCHGGSIVRPRGHEVAQPSVRSQVGHPGTVVGRKPGQRAQLVEDVVAHFGRCQVHGPAAEAPEVRKAGVGADSDSAANAFGDRGVHDVRVTGVKAARYVCAGHNLEQGLVIPHGVGAEALAQISDEINCRIHLCLTNVDGGQCLFRNIRGIIFHASKFESP